MICAGGRNSQAGAKTVASYVVQRYHAGILLMSRGGVCSWPILCAVTRREMLDAIEKPFTHRAGDARQDLRRQAYSWMKTKGSTLAMD